MTDSKTIPDKFWGQIDHQLDRIRAEKPTDFAGLRSILHDPAYDQITDYVNQNGTRNFNNGQAFFAGTGGDAHLVHDTLAAVSWRIVSAKSPYEMAVVNPAGQTVVYTEGDLDLVPVLDDGDIAEALTGVDDEYDITVRALRDLSALRSTLRRLTGAGWVSAWSATVPTDVLDVKEQLEDNKALQDYIDLDDVLDAVQDIADNEPAATAPTVENPEVRVPAERYTVVVPDFSPATGNLKRLLGPTPTARLLVTDLSDLPGF